MSFRHFLGAHCICPDRASSSGLRTAGYRLTPFLEAEKIARHITTPLYSPYRCCPLNCPPQKAGTRLRTNAGSFHAHHRPAARRCPRHPLPLPRHPGHTAPHVKRHIPHRNNHREHPRLLPHRPALEPTHDGPHLTSLVPRTGNRLRRSFHNIQHIRTRSRHACSRRRLDTGNHLRSCQPHPRVRRTPARPLNRHSPQQHKRLTLPPGKHLDAPITGPSTPTISAVTQL